MPNTFKYQLLAVLLDRLETEGYPLGTGKYLQIQQLMQQLPDDLPREEWGYVLAPLFARTEQEQKDFYELFEQCLKQVTPEKPERKAIKKKGPQKTSFSKWVIGVALLLFFWGATFLLLNQEPEKVDILKVPFRLNAGDSTTISIQDHALIEPLKQDFESVIKREGKIVETKIKSPLIYSFSAPDGPLGLDTIEVYLESFTGKQINVQFLATISPQQRVVEKEPTLSSILTSLRQFIAKQIWWMWWVILLLFALLILIYIRRPDEETPSEGESETTDETTLVAEMETTDKPPYFWNIKTNDLPNISFGYAFKNSLTRLRQRIAQQGIALDIPQTIQATIEQAGMPSFRYQKRARPPEYLLLIDQHNQDDHQAQLFEALYQGYRANEVLIERFFFSGDPRVCFNKEHLNGIRLVAIHQRYREARLIIISNGYTFLSDITGKPAKWTGLFNHWKDKVLFTSRPPSNWGRQERQLKRLFPVLPAAIESLNFWLDESELEEPHFEQWKEKLKIPQDDFVLIDSDIIGSLKASFSLQEMKWIAACAMYPSLHWNLTLFVGHRLSDPEDPLLDFRHLSRLFRLPWFVEGQMPKVIRGILVEWLSKEDQKLLSDVRKWLVEILEDNPPPKDSVAFEDFQMNLLINQWMLATEPRAKQALEDKITQLLESGEEIDITIIKELEGEPGPLDFVLPDSWRKYLYRLNLETPVTSTEQEGVQADSSSSKPDTTARSPLITELLNTLVLVEGDTFTMGCLNESRDGNCDDDEKPPHTVNVPSFYMSKYEVTNEAFCAFLNEKGNQVEGGTLWYRVDGNSSRITEETSDSFMVEKGFERHPVNYVSWYGATAFCAWLSEKSGTNIRLPSEAEWEFAARGGKKSQAYRYSGSNNLDEVGWYSSNSQGATHIVGTKKANEIGLHDMSGNLWEWCQDCWHDSYDNAPSDGSPWLESGQGRCNARVLRGGSWSYIDVDCRSSNRSGYSSIDRYNDVGFRFVQGF